MPEPSEIEGFDLRMNIKAVRIIHDCIDVALERWPGGDPEEQQYLLDLKCGFYKLLLENMFYQ